MVFEDEEFEDEEEEEVEEKSVKKPGKKLVKKQKQEERYVVMKELPSQQIRSYIDEDTNVIMNVQTNEEAMTDMRNILNNLEKNFKNLTGGL